jgi:hypothetical protein
MCHVNVVIQNYLKCSEMTFMQDQYKTTPEPLVLHLAEGHRVKDRCSPASALGVSATEIIKKIFT